MPGASGSPPPVLVCSPTGPPGLQNIGCYGGFVVVSGLRLAPLPSPDYGRRGCEFQACNHGLVCLAASPVQEPTRSLHQDKRYLPPAHPRWQSSVAGTGAEGTGDRSSSQRPYCPGARKPCAGT